MADPFEQELDALFATPPSLDGADRFAATVERRLRRRWVLRWVAVGAAGLVGGTISLSRLGDLAQALEPMFGWVAPTAALLPAGPYGTAVLWSAAGLATFVAVTAARTFRRLAL